MPQDPVLRGALGGNPDDVPPCAGDIWELGTGGDSEMARQAVVIFAILHRDKLIISTETKKALKEWRDRTKTALDDTVIMSEVERVYSSTEPFNCAAVKKTEIGKHCEWDYCDFVRRYRGPRAWLGAEDIKIEDVVEFTEKKNGERSVKFSPDKASATIIKRFDIVSTPDEKIWIYGNGIWEPIGDLVVDQVLDRLAGDIFTSRMAMETRRKIVLRTMKDYTIFNARPNLFCVQNGVLDMATGRFMDHSPEYYLTTKAPVKYDPKASCPITAKFLRESLDSDDNIISVLDILTAKTTAFCFEYFGVAIGGGANGKTILQELIRRFYGDDQVAEVEIATLTQNRFDRIELYNKRFLLNSEVTGDLRESRIIKAISGGSRLDADQKNREHIQFRPHCFVFFDTNNPPRFHDTSYGFQRRLVKIDFPYAFVDDPKLPNEKKRDPDLIKKMTTSEELSGLLNLLILNAPSVLAQNVIYRRTSGEELSAEYDLQANSLAAFMDKFVIQADQAWFIASHEVYEYYIKFCKIINAVPVRERDFNAYIKRHYDITKSRKWLEDKTYTRIIYGIDFIKRDYDQFCTLTTREPHDNHMNQHVDHMNHMNHMKRKLIDRIDNISLYKEIGDLGGSCGLSGPASDSCGSNDEPHDSDSELAKIIADRKNRIRVIGFNKPPSKGTAASDSLPRLSDGSLDYQELLRRLDDGPEKQKLEDEWNTKSKQTIKNGG